MKEKKTQNYLYDRLQLVLDYISDYAISEYELNSNECLGLNLLMM